VAQAGATAPPAARAPPGSVGVGRQSLVRRPQRVTRPVVLARGFDPIRQPPPRAAPSPAFLRVTARRRVGPLPTTAFSLSAASSADTLARAAPHRAGHLLTARADTQQR
jgi:hypothetical protein